MALARPAKSLSHAPERGPQEGPASWRCTRAAHKVHQGVSLVPIGRHQNVAFDEFTIRRLRRLKEFSGKTYVSPPDGLARGRLTTYHNTDPSFCSLSLGIIHLNLGIVVAMIFWSPRSGQANDTIMSQAETNWNGRSFKRSRPLPNGTGREASRRPKVESRLRAASTSALQTATPCRRAEYWFATSRA